MRAHLATLAAVAIAACAPSYVTPPCDPAPLAAGADGGLEATGAHVLTTMGRTHDEDPSLVRAKDGSFYLAWLSDRDGNDEIYVMRSVDGVSWGAPARATFNGSSDWYPTLLQGRDDRFYLLWFRALRTSPGTRHVLFNSSDDGLSWNFAQERELTTGSVDDWAPMMLQTSADDLLVYFSRQAGTASGTMDLYSTRSGDLGASWTAPALLPGISDAWSSPQAITSDDTLNFVDSIPSLYRDQSSPEWYLLWTSTGPGAPVVPKVQELALSERGLYPSSAIDTTPRGMRGYSAHAVATQVTGLYLGVWAQQQDGHARLCWQAFARP